MIHYFFTSGYNYLRGFVSYRPLSRPR